MEILEVPVKLCPETGPIGCLWRKYVRYSPIEHKHSKLSNGDARRQHLYFVHIMLECCKILHHKCFCCDRMVSLCDRLFLRKFSIHKVRQIIQNGFLNSEMFMFQKIIMLTLK